ncbi:MAG: WbqC family protein [Putridiphycobacter sp.]
MTPILPVTYFGNLEYFWYFTKYPNVIIDTEETYQKQTFRTRTEIFGANGKLSLSVPVNRPYGKVSTVNQIEISYTENWQKNHWKSIESAYRRTPFYEFYADDIQAILFNPFSTLKELNLTLTNHLIDKLGIDCLISVNQFNKKIEKKDFKTLFNPKLETQFKSKPYIQTFSDRNPFMNNLSILDLLFNEGPNSICILEVSGY